MQCNNPIWIEQEGNPKRGVEVPCGKCIYCMETKRSVWTFRILQELKVAETARFVTLTYDEKYLPYRAIYGGVTYKNKIFNWKDEKTDTLWKLPEKINGLKSTSVESTLKIQDLQKFMKDIRNNIYKDQINNVRGLNKDLKEEGERYLKQSKKTAKWSPKLRYFACGEYGNKSKTERPHFHVILYNIPLRWYKWDPIHEEWYSNKLEDIWNKGIVHVGEVSRESAHYVAKYTIKHLLDEWDETDIRTAPFAVMSKNPGIGNNYIQDEQIRNYYNSSKTSYTSLKNGIIQPIGRYYKDKIWPKKTPEEWAGDRLQIWPKERIEATRNTMHHVKEKQERDLNKEIDRFEGDIQAAEKSLRDKRKESFENALRQKRNNQLKSGGKL